MNTIKSCAYFMTFILLTALTTGCVAVPDTSFNTPKTVQQIASTYKAGNYNQAYQLSLTLMHEVDKNYRALAFYYAGKCSIEFKNDPAALKYFLQASQYAVDNILQADSCSEIGLLYAKSAQHTSASKYFLKAAKFYPQGRDRANAYYYAAVSQQKIGQLSQARQSLYLARGSNADATLLTQIDNQLRVTGYTIQIGAYSTQKNAIAAARNVALKALTMRLDKPKIVEIKTPQNKTYYRVQVGAFSSYKNANLSRQRLGVKDTIVVPIIQK